MKISKCPQDSYYSTSLSLYTYPKPSLLKSHDHNIRGKPVHSSFAFIKCILTVKLYPFLSDIFNLLASERFAKQMPALGPISQTRKMKRGEAEARACQSPHNARRKPEIQLRSRTKTNFLSRFFPSLVAKAMY